MLKKGYFFSPKMCCVFVLSLICTFYAILLLFIYPLDNTVFKRDLQIPHGRIQRGGRGPDAPPEKSQHIGFLRVTSPDPLKNYNTTKPILFNVGPSSACQQNAISMAFCWRADDGLLFVVFGSSLLI